MQQHLKLQVSQIRCDIRENSVDVPLILSHFTKFLMID